MFISRVEKIYHEFGERKTDLVTLKVQRSQMKLFSKLADQVLRPAVSFVYDFVFLKISEDVFVRVLPVSDSYSLELTFSEDSILNNTFIMKSSPKSF